MTSLLMWVVHQDPPPPHPGIRYGNKIDHFNCETNWGNLKDFTYKRRKGGELIQCFWKKFFGFGAQVESIRPCFLHWIYMIMFRWCTRGHRVFAKFFFNRQDYRIPYTTHEHKLGLYSNPNWILWEFGQIVWSKKNIHLHISRWSACAKG